MGPRAVFLAPVAAGRNRSRRLGRRQVEPLREVHRSLDERDRRESSARANYSTLLYSSPQKPTLTFLLMTNACPMRNQYRVLILSPLGHLLGNFAPYASLTPSPAAVPSSTKAGPRPARPTKTAVPTPFSASAKQQQQQPPRGSEQPISKAAKESDHDRARSERSTAAYVGLGIRTVEWHPSGEYLAIGGWDGKVSRVYFCVSLVLSFPQARSTTGLCTWTLYTSRDSLLAYVATAADPDSIWVDRARRVEPADTIIRRRKARSSDRTLDFLSAYT